MAEDDERWLLRKDFEEIGVNFRTVWDLYLKFYTVFLTFNILAMAWLFGQQAGTQMPGNVRRLVVGVFMLQCALTATTSALVAQYSRKSREHIVWARRALMGRVPDADETSRGALPIDLARWAGWANFWAMISLILAWGALGLGLVGRVAQ